MNTLPEAHLRDRPQRLRYLTPEQLGGPAMSGAPHLAFLLPSEKDLLQQEQDLAAEKIAGLEQRIAEMEREVAIKTERSRLEGEEAGRGKVAGQFQRALAECRCELAASAEAFREERRKYFQRVESGVVKLALAIARKILHREAQIDSALLTGIVRAALDRLEEGSGAVLRVPPAEAGGWRAALAGLPKPPALAEDDKLSRGSAVLESKMGTIELSIETQLREIERGFFDLLHQNPEQSPDPQNPEQRSPEQRTPTTPAGDATNAAGRGSRTNA